ncbi:MAG: dihydroorotase [Polyangiales bacterium]
MIETIALVGGRILDPASGTDARGDVVVEHGKVTRIGKDAARGVDGERVRRVDVSGRWVCPGFIDLHVHLREPGHEYKEDIASGLRAAAAGGFTTVCPMPNTLPVNDTRVVTEMMIRRARESSGAKLRPFAAITKGQQGVELTEMGDLRDGGAIGVSDDGKCVMNAAVMRNALNYAKTYDLLLSQHCEDHHLTEGAQMHEGVVSTRLGLRGWPRVAEDIIVARDILLAESVGARYHVAHISSKNAVAFIAEAKSRGLPVTAEVTPHHLALTDESVLGYNTYCKVNPPLRTEEDRQALIAALRDGTIDCIATDHAPHAEQDKNCEFEAASVGINGLETTVSALLELVNESAISATRLIESLTLSPAKIIGDDQIGRIAVGCPADITVIDPSWGWTMTPQALRSRSFNPWLNKQLVGKAVLTLSTEPSCMQANMKTAYLVLADGTRFEGVAVGASGTTTRRCLRPA